MKIKTMINLIAITYIFMCLFYWTTMIIIASINPDWIVESNYNKFSEGRIELIITIMLTPLTIYYLINNVKIEAKNY